MKVAVLYGGISPERNVSITGGLAVIKALQELGHEVVPIDPAYGANGKQSIEEIISPSNSISLEELAKFESRKIIECVNSSLFDGIDVAFIVLHGKYGEDGKIQALLELRGIPYTGSNIKASAIGIDKLASKMLFLAAGISTPQWLTVREKDFGNYEYFEEIRSELGDNLVIKPNDQGSTIGITIVEDGNLDEINKGVDLASKFSDIVIVEQFIEGREITVGIVGGEALPLIEIEPEEGFYDYEHKYTKGKTEYICPAEVTEDIAEFMQNQALSAYNIIGCSGFARADFRLDDEGQPFLLEINTIPGFTATSLVPMAAKEIGIEFPELCDRIIQLVFNKNNNHIDENEEE
ncbi:MAG: D-alanine--D-alanine ligase [Bacteroidetes bacterium]|nr:MAG: D-alanine--D-alanine ligase [Bacteroidota bacterium]